ncbi:hypothetical protein Tco_1155886 [Tanacetum coccineum]
MEERAKLIHDTVATQRRFLAEQRVAAIKNRPPTRTQLTLYEKVKRFDESFTIIGFNEDERKIKEMNEGASDPDKKKKFVKEDVLTNIPAKPDVAEQGTKKRKGGHMKMLDFGLEVEVDSTAALDLIRFIKQQLNEEVLNSPCFMVKSWLVQDQTVLGSKIHIQRDSPNSSVDIASVNMHECEKCLKLETELLHKKDFIEKEIYDKLDNSVSNQNALSFDQLFEINELKAQSQEKDTVIKKVKKRIKSLSGKMNEDKIKKDLKEIETINIELDHRVKLKGKALVDNVVTKHTIDPEMLKIDVEPITPKLLNKKTAHSAYIKHTQEEATVLRDLVEHVKSKYPLDHSLESACRYAKLIQELLTHISKTCPSVNNTDGKLVAVTPKNKDKRVRFTEPVTSSGNTITKTASTSNLHSKLNANSELKCVKCNGCMLSDNHDLCVLDFINNMNAHKQSKSVKKSSREKFGNQQERITTTTKVPLRKPTALENETPKPVVTLVYSRKPRKSQTNVPVSKSKVLKFVSANKKKLSQSWGSIVSDVPSSSLDDCRSSKLFSVKFGNDHMAKIMGYGDYQIGNVMISKVYYVEGLGHNLFSVGQFCDSNLEVAFRQHTFFICNLEGVNLLTGS